MLNSKHFKYTKRSLKALFIYILFNWTLNSYGQKHTTQHVSKLSVESRADFEYFKYDTLPDKGGFAGKNINVILDGHLNQSFSFKYRQRMNLKNVSFSSFFQGTDWMYLTYKPNKSFAISAGKQVVDIGGYEYGEAPIDAYFWSDFWDNVVCYEMGVGFTYTDHKQQNNLSFQITNSPFVKHKHSNIYAYNLMWRGQNSSYFNTTYSINAVESRKNQYIYYLALGNQFKFKNGTFYVDVMNRFDHFSRFWFKDYSIIGELKYQISDKWTVFSKGGYDTNIAQSPHNIKPTDYFDQFIVPGTKFAFGGLGSEYYPLDNDKSLRIHGFIAVKKRQNHVEHLFNIGVTWRFNLLKFINKQQTS